MSEVVNVPWRCRVCGFIVSGAELDDLCKTGTHLGAWGHERYPNAGTAWCPTCTDETLIEQNAPMDTIWGADKALPAAWARGVVMTWHQYVDLATALIRSHEQVLHRTGRLLNPTDGVSK